MMVLFILVITLMLVTIAEAMVIQVLKSESTKLEVRISNLRHSKEEWIKLYSRVIDDKRDVELKLDVSNDELTRRVAEVRKAWESEYDALSNRWVETDRQLTYWRTCCDRLNAERRSDNTLEQNLTNTQKRCTELLLENRELKKDANEAKRNEGPAAIPGGAGCYGTIKGCYCLACIFGSGAV